MSQLRKPLYHTTNSKQYNAAPKARGLLTIWGDKRMAWFTAASCKRGRSPKFSDTATQCCLTLKNLLNIAMQRWPYAGDEGDIWKRWNGYQRRSVVEAKMNCIKRLGERVMSRTFERQVNELHIRAVMLNRFTERGGSQTAAVA